MEQACEVAKAALIERATNNQADPVAFRQDLLNIARTTLSSKILTQVRRSLDWVGLRVSKPREPCVPSRRACVLETVRRRASLNARWSKITPLHHTVSDSASCW